MNAYEIKQEARRERYEEKAEKLRAEARRLHGQAHDMLSAIPLGQPILIGHHSEKRDRRYRDRIESTFGRAFGDMEKAKYYERKAESVGKGGISSDDPDALKKLWEKLDALKKKQALMKAVNAAIRKHKTPEKQIPAIVALGISEATAQKLLEPNCYGGQGFMSFSLQNNNANIRRVEQRIKELEQAAERNVTQEEEGNGYTYREDAEENRVMFIFDGKPDAGIRDILKGRGFKWSPTRGAWVRMLNNAGRYAASEVRAELEKMGN